jgi:hypothetical protein
MVQKVWRKADLENPQKDGETPVPFSNLTLSPSVGHRFQN